MCCVTVLGTPEPEEAFPLDRVVLPMVVEVHLNVRGADVHLEDDKHMRVRKRRRRRFYLVTALTLDAVVVSLLFVVAALLQWTRVTPIHCYLLFIPNCSGAVFQCEAFERGLCRFDNSAQCSLLDRRRWRRGLAEQKPRGKVDAKLITTVAHQGGNRHQIHNHTTMIRISMELIQTWN